MTDWVAVALDDIRAVADTPFGGVEGVPSGGARGLASRYVGYWDHADHAVRRREVPGMGVTLILSMGPSMQVSGPAMRLPVTVRSFVAGLHQGPAMTEHDGLQSGIQVDLQPLAARSILGAAMDDLADRTTNLEEVLGASAERLMGSLAEARTWSERFGLLDAALAEAARTGPAPSVESRWLHGQLLRRDADSSVARLVEETGRSHRHLVAGFKRDVGLGPKAFTRLVRFRRAVELIRAGRPLALVAAGAGYYDQAHLGREFRALAGTTPGRYRQEEVSQVNFVQDGEHGDP